MNALITRLKAPYAAQGYTGLALEWKLLTRLFLLTTAWLQARWSLRKATQMGRMVFAYGRPSINLARLSDLQIGEDVRMESGVHRLRLSVHHKARLIIGNNVYLNGCIISANSEVIIKDGVKMGPWAHVMDGDFHGVEDREKAVNMRPVIIEEDAWLATRCMVLKGVTIGRGAVVAAGSVVTKDVEPYTVVAGIPAQVVKRLPLYAAFRQNQEASKPNEAPIPVEAVIHRPVFTQRT